MQGRKILSAILVLFLTIALTPKALASSSIVDSDVVETDSTRLSLVLFKDTCESDPDWDYYALLVTVEDIKYRNDWWTGPLGLRLYLYVNGEEVPASHQPTSAWRWSQGIVGFSYKGVSFQLQVPAYAINYGVTDYAGGLKRYEWTVTGVCCYLAFWFIYDDYAEFAVGVRVPDGQAIYAYAGVAVSYYKFCILWFDKIEDDLCYWAYVSHSPSISASLIGSSIDTASCLTPPSPVDLGDEIRARPRGGARWDVRICMH